MRFKKFENIQPYNKINIKEKIFNVNGKEINLKMYYGKIYDIEEVQDLDLSYQELIDSGIWEKVNKDEKHKAIGDSYTWFWEENNISAKDLYYLVGEDVICFSDKVYYYGETSVKEGKIYKVLGVGTGRSFHKLIIHNDNGRKIYATRERFATVRKFID